MVSKRFALIGNQAFSLLNFRGPLVADLVARGHQVAALAPDLDADSRAAIAAIGATPLGYKLSRTGLNPFADLGTALSLWSALRNARPDTVFSYGIKPVIYGTLAAWVAGVPRRYALVAGLGYTFGDTQGLSLPRRALRFIAATLYRFSLGRANLVFMQNDDDLAAFVSQSILPREKLLRVNGTGVDLTVWTPEKPVTDPVTFILAARLLREKGIAEFVDAARLIKAKRSNVRFVVLGGLDSNPSGITKAEMDHWVDEGLIEWPGHVAVRPWLAAASVFVLPTYYREGVPRSIQEAMALGRPVITTDSPGCRDTVDEGVNGFLVPPRDVAALAAAMLRFVDEPSRIAQMGNASRRRAEDRYDVRRINAAMLDAMQL